MNNYEKRKYHIFIIIFTLSSLIIPNINGFIIINNNDINKDIGINEVIKIANSYILKQQKQNFIISGISNIKDDFQDKTLFYIVNLNPIGFIVVTNNINLPPIISYSFTNQIGVINQENILIKILKTDITERLKYVDKLSEDIIKNRHKLWQEYLSISNNYEQNNLIMTIGPLLDTKWTQNAPYNNFCPMDKVTGQRSVAGCPAVAMAQILNYHKTTRNIQFNDSDDYYHNYGGNRYRIDDDSESYDFPSFPELNSYLNTLQYHYDNGIPVTNDDKAAINFACGVAAKQVYASGGSGTFGVNQAFSAYKRFSFKDVQLLDEDDNDLYTRLKENILENLPAHIAVVNEGWTVGHNMVVDGYNEQDYYHINFGWGGSYDNWYDLPEELPFELTVIEGIIVDIIPETPKSDLNAYGSLSWIDIKPNSTVTGDFIIKNVGDSGSSIDWEISSYPEWGIWTFNPESGEDLKPEYGNLTIEVTVLAPDNKNSDFDGYVKIVNKNNIEDYCIIPALMKTPRIYNIDISILNLIKNYFSKYF